MSLYYSFCNAFVVSIYFYFVHERLLWVGIFSFYLRSKKSLKSIYNFPRNNSRTKKKYSSKIPPKDTPFPFRNCKLQTVILTKINLKLKFYIFVRWMLARLVSAELRWVQLGAYCVVAIEKQLFRFRHSNIFPPFSM